LGYLVVRIGIALFAAIGLLLAAPGTASAKKIVDDQDTVWIYGDKMVVWSDGCGLKNLKSKLQIKEAGEWVTVAKGKEVNKKKTACKDNGRFRYQTRYKFTLDMLGQPVPGERYSQLQVREVWKAYGKRQKNVFVKKVYLNEEDLARDLLDTLTCVVEGTC